MADAAASKFLSQAEFARRRGVSRKAVTGWKAKGLLVFSDAGLIDVQETEWKLDERPSRYRGGVTHRPVRAVDGNKRDDARPKAERETVKVTKPGRVVDDEPSQTEPTSDLSADNLPMAEAVRRKENFLGLLRKHEFEVGQKEWVKVEEVGQIVEHEYATVRERLLIIPGKIAALLVGLDRPAIEIRLREEVFEALNELHDPDGLAQRLAASDASSAGTPGAETASHTGSDRLG